MKIQVVPPDTPAQPAAGEVVERPASVVKALAENAIEADAPRIHVPIKQGGTRSIWMHDKRSSVPADQAETAFSSNAASKLRTDDLRNTATLGFRNVALHSIAASLS